MQTPATRPMTLHSCGLIAWVIMPEHVHLIVRPTQPEYSIAKILQSIKQASSRKASEAWRRGCLPNPGPWILPVPEGRKTFRLWQRGVGHNFNLIDPETLRMKVEYIHANPLHRGLARSPDEWEWSSYRDWMEMREPIIPLDRKWAGV